MFLIDLIILFVALIGLLYFYTKYEPDNINNLFLYKLYLLLFVFLILFITNTVFCCLGIYGFFKVSNCI